MNTAKKGACGFPQTSLLLAVLTLLALALSVALPQMAKAAGTWADTGPLSIGRAYHTATLLDNGKVLVAGGDGELRPLLKGLER